MQLREILDDAGRLVGLEVDSFPRGRRGLCRILRTVPRVRIRRAPRFVAWFSEEPFCVFEVNGEIYHAADRTGANARYWIGPKVPGAASQMERVREALMRW